MARERVKRKIGESKRKNKQTNRAAENELKIKAKAAASARNANELKNLNEDICNRRESLNF